MGDMGPTTEGAAARLRALDKGGREAPWTAETSHDFDAEVDYPAVRYNCEYGGTAEVAEVHRMEDAELIAEVRNLLPHLPGLLEAVEAVRRQGYGSDRCGCDACATLRSAHSALCAAVAGGEREEGKET